MCVRAGSLRFSCQSCWASSLERCRRWGEWLLPPSACIRAQQMAPLLTHGQRLCRFTKQLKKRKATLDEYSTTSKRSAAHAGTQACFMHHCRQRISRASIWDSCMRR